MADQGTRTGFGGVVLYLLAALGILLTIWRFANGIGAVSNLNQGYPWGFWIGFDVLAGIALAAGGFVVAALVHIFGGERYHSLVRPAILTSFLGYLVFIVALLIDLGRPWAIWHMIFYWQHESPMFEVGWCVMLYTTVLLFEFLPVILEKYGQRGLLSLWLNISPLIAWGLLVFFAIALTQSTPWVLAIAGILLLFEILVRAGVLRRDPRAPTLLMMAGVIFSILHQSSLGTLFTMVPHKLNPLWFSPILPVLFFLSAVMAGLAMVIVEATLTAGYLNHKPRQDLLQGLGRGLSWAIMVYMVVRITDLAVRGAVGEILTVKVTAFAFWGELMIGFAIPLAMLLTEEIIRSAKGLFWAAFLVIIGVIFNRLNVAVTGITAHYAEGYSPHWMEIAISLGVISAGILVFRYACRHLPIFEEQASSV